MNIIDMNDFPESGADEWQEVLDGDAPYKILVRRRTINPGQNEEKDIVEFYNTATSEIKTLELPRLQPKIHSTAIIGPNVEIGEGTYIGPYCIIGYPAEHKQFWPTPDGKGIIGKVIIGRNCVLTGHVTVDAGTENPTIIGNNVWMLKHSHVGHDAIICDNTTISCGAKVGGHASVGYNCNLGLNCTIHQRKVIPDGCMIGMGAVVPKNLQMEPFRKYAGVPAKDIGSNIK